MTSARKLRSKLESNIRGEKFVKVRRLSRPSYTIDGFVLAIGDDWVLLSKVMDGGYFDGYAAIRIADIKNVDVDKSFQSRFAQTRPEWPPTAPPSNGPVDLDSTRGMLTTLLQPDRLFGIERNKSYDALWIGVPNELRKRWLYLWEVDSRGRWDEEPLGYKLSTITTVVFDDHYQTALTATAGRPPVGASADWPTAIE